MARIREMRNGKKKNQKEKKKKKATKKRSFLQHKIRVSALSDPSAESSACPCELDGDGRRVCVSHR
jgi:hypothetical protein